MNKQIDLDKNVAELCGEYPELKQIMAELGFKDITKPLVLNTMGRMMTIPKGATIKEIPLSKMIDAFEAHGFQVIHIPNDLQTEKKNETLEVKKAEDTNVNRTNNVLSEKEVLLKDYISRLTAGEDIEQVKEEFRQNFSDVSAVEIARAEQALLREGTPLESVQKLCDVHSALFHGKTSAERIESAEKEVARSAREEKMDQISKGFDEEIAFKTREQMNMEGHPLYVLTLENQAIAALVSEVETEFQQKKEMIDLLPRLKKLTTIAQHYGKKDELMFPLLKDVYDYPGPSDVMWGVEDEIRDSLRQLIAMPEDENAEILLEATLKRIREMIYKEENILFPLCTANFTEEEWIAIARDMPMFGPCMIEEIPTWNRIKDRKQDLQIEKGTVVLPGGRLTLSQLRVMLNTLPLEITLIDENDVNQFFNEGEKLFTRPTMAIGRKVYSCHPKRVEPMVRLLIHEFKTGKKDSMHILSEKCGKQVLINYYALRDEAGTYLGTMEAVQEIDHLADAIKKGKRGPVNI